MIVNYFLKKLLNIEFIGSAIVVFVVLYFIFSQGERRKYPFVGLRKGISTNNLKPLVINRKRAIRNRKKDDRRSAVNDLKNSPNRSTSIKEERARKIFESIYGKKFPPVRPGFLRNPATGHNLEIDGYNDGLKLGFEFNGRQHSEYTPHFHSNKNQFIYQVARDDYKKKRCEMLGITLIVIPHYVTLEDIETYIRIRLKKAGKLY